MSGRASPGGNGGNGLAHQLASAHLAALGRGVPKLRCAPGAGGQVPAPGGDRQRPEKPVLAWDAARSCVAELMGAGAGVPVVHGAGGVARAGAGASRIDRALAARAVAGVAVGEHEAMSAFFDDLHASRCTG